MLWGCPWFLWTGFALMFQRRLLFFQVDKVACTQIETNQARMKWRQKNDKTINTNNVIRICMCCYTSPHVYPAYPPKERSNNCRKLNGERGNNRKMHAKLQTKTLNHYESLPLTRPSQQKTTRNKDFNKLKNCHHICRTIPWMSKQRKDFNIKPKDLPPIP